MTAVHALMANVLQTGNSVIGKHMNATTHAIGYNSAPQLVERNAHIQDAICIGVRNVLPPTGLS